MDKNEFYINPNMALDMLAERQRLRSQVEAWWVDRGWGLPEFFAQNQVPVGVFCRQVATARYEDVAFAKIARRVGLMPVWAEYVADKFSDKNSYKRSLLRRHTCQGRGRNGGLKLGLEKLADTVKCNGETLHSIEVIGGIKLPDYHHRLQDAIIPNPIRFDISDWLKGVGEGRASDYYTASLSLWLAHGVLFEDYHGGESGNALDGFTARIFEPAWQSMKRIFGYKPLIVPMPWQKEFAYYPTESSPECMQVIAYD